MFLFKLLNGFVKVVPLPNKTKLKISKLVEVSALIVLKVSSESKYSMPWI